MHTPNLLALLDRQQEQLTLLLSLLTTELTAISQRNVSALEQCVQDKQALLDAISNLDQQISVHPDLALQKQTTAFIDKVDAIDVILHQCKIQNEINQQSLEKSQLVLERFKAEILGQRGKSGLTYTAKGKPAIDAIGKGIKA
jgi:flagellar biosynthesis/type III secretory pathway chaperone